MKLAEIPSLHGHPLLYLPECDSTNRVARARAREGGSGVVLAEHQTAGRGRQGRSWLSPPGLNLTFSVILRPPVAAADAPRCVLAWAAAMAEALDVFVKWPNDLVDACDLKLGGILAEMETEGEQLRFVVLGVGVNVNQVDFADLPEATSLARVRGGVQDRVEVLRCLVAAIHGADLREGLDLWRARARTLGRRVRVGEVEGMASGLRDDGALLVDGRPILAGDVRMVSDLGT